jgi:bacillithiol synthase
MIKATVDPECTGQFSPLFLDYIRQKPEILFLSITNIPNLEFQKPYGRKNFDDE